MSHHLVYTFVLFTSTIFFSVLAILRIPYGGTESSSIYRNFCIACFVISMLYFLNDFSRGRHSKRNFISILIMLVYVVTGALSGYVSDKSFLSLTAFGVPAACIAIYYSGRRNISMLVRWLDVIVFILTLSLFFMASGLYYSVSSGDSQSSYSQTLSYFAAFGFLADIFLVRYGSLYPRFRLFKTRIYRTISFLFLPFYPFVILLSGGRGGFVTLFVGLLLFYYTYKGSRSQSLWLVGVLALLIVVIGGTVGDQSSVGLRSMMGDNTNRVFSYINGGGIDMTQTSGRDVVFAKSLSMAMERPVTGYGLFGYKKQLLQETQQGYPHNLFIELFLQGGMLFLFFGVILLFLFFRKAAIIMKSNPQMIMLLPLMVYPFTELMYTGSYMEDVLFWFCVMFVYNYQLPKRQLVRK